MAPLKSPYDIETINTVDVVRVHESKMAYATLESLQKELSARIAGGSRRMVVNLEPVAFVDSFGLGVIVATSRTMSQAGGQLKLCGVGERIMMSLTITRLDRSLDIEADEETAIRSLSGEA